MPTAAHIDVAVRLAMNGSCSSRYHVWCLHRHRALTVRWLVRWFDDRTYRAASDRTASRSQEIIGRAGVPLPEGPEVLLAAAAGGEIEQCRGLLVSVALPALLARLCSRRFQSWRFDRSGYCIRRGWGAYFSSLCVFQRWVQFSNNCPIAAVPRSNYRGNRRIGFGAANSGFDVGSNTHGLSASYDNPRHGLTFSRWAISGVTAFGSLTSRASTVFAGGASTSDFGAAVATASVCTGANANTPRGSESLFGPMRARPPVPVLSAN